MTQPSVPTVDIDSLPTDALVLDVREDDEWAAGHIDGAVHIPMNEVPDRVADLPSGQPVSVVCRSGGRSARVTGFLVQAGVDAHNVAGGMQIWEAAGRPMVSENGAAPSVI
ncbi:MAG TPA: rhodanese-like domain-containing protein [Mycobacteriales bacterium]|jgi:rhodanese-related sulfurtransferase|nr:rhodanese-like domain-containing protein [Mycobacteriales bacterium]